MSVRNPSIHKFKELRKRNDKIFLLVMTKYNEEFLSVFLMNFKKKAKKNIDIII